MSEHVDINNAGKGEYTEVIKKIIAAGKCPFCPENFIYHNYPILKEKGNWLATRNSWPYKNTKYHFILVCKKHKEYLSEMSHDDWKDINDLLHWLAKKYKLSGGAFAMRLGDTKLTGASVRHLHGQFIVPDIGNTKGSNTQKPISDQEFRDHPDAAWFRIG